MLNANNINPTCDIVLNAYNLFILDCVKPNSEPIIKDKSELNRILFFQDIFSKFELVKYIISKNIINIDIFAIIATNVVTIVGI